MPVITMLLSQKGSTYFDLMEIAEIWEENQSMKEANFLVRNIQVSWKITAVNCFYTGNGYLTSDSDLDSSLTLYLEIIVH